MKCSAANSPRIRAALTAADQGDYELVSALFRPDVHWVNDVGAGPYREAHGIEEVFTLLGQWNDLFQGTFRERAVRKPTDVHSPAGRMTATGPGSGPTPATT